MKVRLPKELTLSHAAEAKLALLSALRSGEPLELDAAEVAEVDVAGLQLLCGLHRAARRIGSRVSFDEGRYSTVLRAALGEAGFLRRKGCAPGCFWLRDGDSDG